MYLTNLLFLGDLAETLLTDARKSVGMNLTELQICVQLAEKNVGAMTPQQLGAILCMSQTRVVNRLQALLSDGLVVPSTLRRSRETAVDNRLRFYFITKDGRTAVDKFLSASEVVNSLLLTLTSRKTEDEVARVVMQLRKLSIQGVIASPEKFFFALNDGHVPALKRGGALSLALWHFRQKSLKTSRARS